MKKIKNLFLLASFFFLLTANAQAPEKMSYQAVIRDASNNLISNHAVGMKISLLEGSAAGTVQYVETQTPTTNVNGFVSITIGNGTVVSGTIATVLWDQSAYFLKTEIDPTGGTNYTITSTSQLLSVPYALHSKTTKSVSGAVNYIPFFDTNGSVGTSNIYKDPNTGQIGLNTISPQATFHIRDNYPSLMLSDYGANKLAANFDLSGNANFGTGSASKLRLITDDFSRLEITANGDVLINKTLQVGSNSRRIGAVEFQTFTIGSSTTNSLTVPIFIFNGPMPNSNYVVSVTQVNSNDSDFFQFIVKNKTVNGFELYVQRRDANAGWGQNLQIDYAVICGQ